MKVLFFFFVFLNLVFYLWQSGGSESQANVAMAPLPPGVKKLILVDETDVNRKSTKSKKSKQIQELAKLQRKKNKATKRKKETKTKSKPKPKKQTTRSTSASTKAADVCYALGPFEAKDQVNSISGKLRVLGASTIDRKEKARVPIGYWVYLPKFESWNAARRKVVELESQGMTDAFIMGRGRMKNAVSLGLFKAEKAAKSRINRLQEMGIAPKLETQYTEDERYWIDIDVESGKSQVIQAIETIAKGLTVLDLLPRKCS